MGNIKKKFSWPSFLIFVVALLAVIVLHNLITFFLSRYDLTEPIGLFLPYILDLLIISAVFFYLKYKKEIKSKRLNKLLKIIIWAPFIDISLNFLVFLVGLFFNYKNDVTMIFMKNQGIWFIALILIADWLWWKTINENTNKRRSKNKNAI